MGIWDRAEEAATPPPQWVPFGTADSIPLPNRRGFSDMVSILTLVFLGVVFLVAIMRPAWAVAVVLTMFPTEQALQASAGIFRSIGPLANFTIASIVIASIAMSFLRGTLVWSRWLTSAMLLVAILYTYSAASVLWTFSPEWLSEYIRWTSPYIFVIVVLAPLLVSGMGSLSELRAALLVVGTGVALLIIANPNFQFVEGRLVVNVDADSRTNPLAIGQLGGLVVLLSILGPAKETVRFMVPLRIIAFTAGLGLGFMSGSRGEVIAALFGASVFLPMARKIDNPAQFFATIGVAVVFVAGVLGVRSLFVGADNADRWSSESILFGSAGRLENAMDLARLYFDRPLYWPIGLGSAAFHDLPTRSGDPYSHVIVADLIFELGIPGVLIGLSLAYLTVRNSRALFWRVRGDVEQRALVTFLAAFATYQFILANKAGMLWAQYDLCFSIVLLGRLWALQSDADARAIAAGEFDAVAEDDQEAFEGPADEIDGDSTLRPSPSPGAA